MLRPPPRSPLFPYTTLFRSACARPLRDRRRHHRGELILRQVHLARGGIGCLDATRLGKQRCDHRGKRSEEHTSELQSQSNLVCRLLLEKKKKKIISTKIYNI